VLAITIFADIWAARWFGPRHLAPLPGGNLVWQLIGQGLMWLGRGVRLWAVVVLGR